MPMHGTVLDADDIVRDMLPDGTYLDFETDGVSGSTSCRTMLFLDHEYVRGIQYYSSSSTITRFSLAKYQTNGVVPMP